MKDTLVMIMAGGKGSRLGPLTVHRSKPGVPFAGRYRIIDFVLSNFVNSGYRRIYVLTQYMSSSLIKHLSRNWRLSGFGEYIEVVPAQMRLGEFWYRGTADAVYQNLNLVRDAQAAHVAVFGGDHVYKFDVEQMEVAPLKKLIVGSLLHSFKTVGGGAPPPVPISPGATSMLIDHAHPLLASAGLA